MLLLREGRRGVGITHHGRNKMCRAGTDCAAFRLDADFRDIDSRLEGFPPFGGRRIFRIHENMEHIRTCNRTHGGILQPTGPLPVDQTMVYLFTVTKRERTLCNPRHYSSSSSSDSSNSWEFSEPSSGLNSLRVESLGWLG